MEVLRILPHGTTLSFCPISCFLPLVQCPRALKSERPNHRLKAIKRPIKPASGTEIPYSLSANISTVSQSPTLVMCTEQKQDRKGRWTMVSIARKGHGKLKDDLGLGIQNLPAHEVETQA